MRIILLAIMFQLVLPFWQPVVMRLMENHIADSGHMPICTAVGVAYIDESGEGSGFTPDYYSPLAFIDKLHLNMAALDISTLTEPAFYVSTVRYLFSTPRIAGLVYQPYLSRDPPEGMV